MKVEAWFCEDLPGGYELECQGCHHTDAYVGEDDPPYPEPWICKGCGAKMYYPLGASW